MTSEIPEPPTSPSPNRDRSTRIAAAICCVLVAIGALASYGLSRRLPSSTAPSGTPAPANAPDLPPAGDASGEENRSAAQQEMRAVVYRLRDTGQRFELVPETLTVTIATAPAAATPAVRVEAALRALFSAPVPPNASHAVPEGVAVERLALQDDEIYLDLSEEFTSGGGSASMQGRLAQVLYTATEADPTAALWLSVAGKPLTLLGGEGLDVPQPLTRENFEANFSL